MSDIFLTEEETADIFGVHRTTLRRSVDGGLLPLRPIFITPHTRRYRRDEVESLSGVDPTKRKEAAHGRP